MTHYSPGGWKVNGALTVGGALVQDIRTEWNFPSEYPPLPHAKKERNEKQNEKFRHAVRLEEGSLVGRVVQIPPGDLLTANSTHHQSVHPGRVGAHLRASAWSPDGVIEAIEPSPDSPWARSGRFVLGVQWHPEQMQNEAPHRNIFRALIEAALDK
jgi:putative glutamine amidotransferase